MNGQRQPRRLDPNSPQGREFVRGLTEILGELTYAVEERKHAAARQAADTKRGAA